jgi:hypothetical protein
MITILLALHWMIPILIAMLVLAVLIYVAQLLFQDPRVRNIVIAVIVVLFLIYLIGDYGGRF